MSENIKFNNTPRLSLLGKTILCIAIILLNVLIFNSVIDLDYPGHIALYINTPLNLAFIAALRQL